MDLLKDNKYVDNIIKESFEHNNIPLYSKLYLFLEALKKNNENVKIEKSYLETKKSHRIRIKI